MLFLKSVSGTRYSTTSLWADIFHSELSGRVVAPGEDKTIGPHQFSNWGSHHNSYPTPYFTAAAAIWMHKEEVDVFIERLDKVFIKFKKKKEEPAH